MTESRLGLPWWRYLGPWSLRPWITFWIVGSFFSWATSMVTVVRLPDNPGQTIALSVLNGVLAAGAISLTMTAFRRWGQRLLATLPGYLVCVAIMVTPGMAVRFLTGQIPAAYMTQLPGLVALGYLRTYVLVLIILMSVGLVTERLRQQVARTEEALAVAREQQIVLLQADELTRRQIAGLLHDRVQAGLIAACLELQAYAAHVDTDDRGEVMRVIERLENLRRLDVRQAARTLSPSLSEVDLLTALEELAAQYEPGMRTTVQVQSAVDELATVASRQVLLGCYRIVEQALLNAAGHGHARNCLIDVRLGADGAVHVLVSDDGRGLTGHGESDGVGTTLITTWTRALNGRWQRGPGPAGGVDVRAVLPASP